MKVVNVVLLVLVFFASAAAQMDGPVVVESKNAYPGQQGVTVGVTVYVDLPLIGMTIPIIVREIDPGSFWTGTLPFDTGGTAFVPPTGTAGVTWNWTGGTDGRGTWASLLLEMRPGVPYSPCTTDGDVGYDGISPDHFVLNAAGAGGHEPAAPDGREVVAFTFDVTDNPGQFEFDTACFSGSLDKIFLIDEWWNPEPPEPVEFERGIITITDCHCGNLGDCDGNQSISPVDVTYMVNIVYKHADPPPPLPWCPAVNGDWNCDGWINPVDISEIVGFVYRNSNIPPCDPCRGGRLPDLAITSTDILSNKDTLEVGEMIWLGVNVHNLGLATAPAPTVAMFRGNPDDGGTLLDVVTAAAIAPGDSLIKFVGQYICETIGEIDLYAIVDWGEEISEMDENNNKASKTIVVE